MSRIFIDPNGVFAVIVVVCAAIATVAFALWIVNRRRGNRAHQPPPNIPLIIFPNASRPEHLPPRPKFPDDDDLLQRTTPPRSAERLDPTPPAPRTVVATDIERFAPPTPPPQATPHNGSNGRGVPGDPFPYTTHSTQATPPPRSRRHVELEVPLTDDDAQETVHFTRPMDGTLQFLPGHLEIVDGQDSGQDIRFVRTSGMDGTQVTFGRSDGPPYRHIQLRERTVSRQHARMSYDGVRWQLSNLSRTNPVVVNGRPLDGVESAVLLTDGDQIEMGEVLFRFHSR